MYQSEYDYSWTNAKMFLRKINNTNNLSEDKDTTFYYKNANLICCVKCKRCAQMHKF